MPEDYFRAVDRHMPCNMAVLAGHCSARAAAGVVRYLVLVYRHADVGRPEKVLYSDWILWLILVGYALTAVYAVMFPQIVQIRELGV